MSNRRIQDTLAPPSGADDEGEGWLTSYLDVLTLLITLFVLLLSMSETGAGNDAASRQATASIAPASRDILPRNDGLQPRFSGLNIDGVSVAEDNRGITLRIDNRLLFDSGEASLTAGGRAVLRDLVDRLDSFDGRVSVEGHTDNVPIATARFPSNWELSTRRATAVLRELVDSGLSRGRLRAIGYADTRPLDSNETASGRAANRRVELLLSQGGGR